MTIFVKNKHTLQIEEFKFKCCIGEKGSTKNKKEGDKKTPKGTFEIENLYFRKDRKEKPLTLLKYIEIKKNIAGLGSCIFIHLTKDFKPTAGCIALKEKDFLIMLKLIKKKTKIKIY